MPKTSKFLAVLTIVVASLGAAGPAFALDDLAHGVRASRSVALGERPRRSGDPIDIGALGDGRIEMAAPADRRTSATAGPDAGPARSAPSATAASTAPPTSAPSATAEPTQRPAATSARPSSAQAGASAPVENGLTTTPRSRRAATKCLVRVREHARDRRRGAQRRDAGDHTLRDVRAARVDPARQLARRRDRRRSRQARSGRCGRGSRPANVATSSSRSSSNAPSDSSRSATPTDAARGPAVGDVVGKPPHERQAVRQAGRGVVEQPLGVLRLGKSRTRHRDALGHGLGPPGALVPARLREQPRVVGRDLARRDRRDAAARAPRPRRAPARSRSCGRPRAARARTGRARSRRSSPANARTRPSRAMTASSMSCRANGSSTGSSRRIAASGSPRNARHSPVRASMERRPHLAGAGWCDERLGLVAQRHRLREVLARASVSRSGPARGPSRDARAGRSGRGTGRRPCTRRTARRREIAGTARAPVRTGGSRDSRRRCALTALRYPGLRCGAAWRWIAASTNESRAWAWSERMLLTSARIEALLESQPRSAGSSESSWVSSREVARQSSSRLSRRLHVAMR